MAPGGAILHPLAVPLFLSEVRGAWLLVMWPDSREPLAAVPCSVAPTLRSRAASSERVKVPQLWQAALAAAGTACSEITELRNSVVPDLGKALLPCP